MDIDQERKQKATVGKTVAPTECGQNHNTKKEVPITPGISPPPFPAFPPAGTGEGRIKPGFKGDVKEGPLFGRKMSMAPPPLGGNSNEFFWKFPTCAGRREGRGAVEIKARAERSVGWSSGESRVRGVGSGRVESVGQSLCLSGLLRCVEEKKDHRVGVVGS